MNPDKAKELLNRQIQIMENCSISSLYASWFYAKGMVDMVRGTLSESEITTYHTLYRQTFYRRVESVPEGKD